MRPGAFRSDVGHLVERTPLAFPCRAPGLAVNNGHSTGGVRGGGKHLDPAQEATFKLCRITTAEHATDGVMRWDAIR
jgi:hypothetical protein